MSPVQHSDFIENNYFETCSSDWGFYTDMPCTNASRGGNMRLMTTLGCKELKRFCLVSFQTEWIFLAITVMIRNTDSTPYNFWKSTKNNTGSFHLTVHGKSNRYIHASSPPPSGTIKLILKTLTHVHSSHRPA